MKRTFILACTLALFTALAAFACPESYADGKLKAFKKSAGVEEREKETEPEAEKKSESPETESDEEGGEEPWNTFLGEFFQSMFEGAAQAVFTDHGFRYRAYPYSKENYVFHDPETKPRGVPGVLKAEYQRVNSDLYSLAWRLTLRMDSGFDLSITDTYYDERLRSHDHDHMKYTRFRLSYLVSPTPGNMLIRVGAGFALIEDYSGLDIGIEVDCFAQAPFTFHIGVCHTVITSHHGVSDIDVALGLMAGPFEFALGYRGLITRDESIDGVYISIGFWF